MLVPSLMAMHMLMSPAHPHRAGSAFAASPLLVHTRGHAGRSVRRWHQCGVKMVASSAEAELPITPLLPELIASLDETPNLVLQAPPGAGKTTSVPLALLRDAAWMRESKGQLLVLEPRRIAARGAATRMASALGEQVGDTVGYRVRQESRTSARTRIVCVTEGMLLRQLQNDPLLEGVAGICFDEFHERSTDGDLCLTLCREAQKQALPDLRLLVMSATLGEGLVEKLSSLLDSCPTLVSEGRGFPVTVSHSGSMPLAGVASMRRRELASTVAAAVLSLLERDNGDVLAFLPGEAEIRDTAAALADSMQARMSAEVEITPLYAALPLEQQTAAVLPHPKGLRRAVLATSIAESSLTLPRVTAVVDCGLRRVSCYEPATGMSGLKTIPISAASAAQRAGRAGRVAPGICVRLWPEREVLEAHTVPQILVDDLAGLALTLAAWGAPCSRSVSRLAWLSPPPQHSLTEAHGLLRGLGAIVGGEGELEVGGGGEGSRVTGHGMDLARMPLHPRLAHMVMAARDMGAGGVEVACALAALIEEREVLADRFSGADINTRIEALLRDKAGEEVDPVRWRRARMTMADLYKTFKRLESQTDTKSRDEPSKNSNGIAANYLPASLLAIGFPDRVGQLQKGKVNTFSLANGRVAGFANAKERMGTSPYIVAASIDGSDKRSARIFLAASITLEALERALGAGGADVLMTRDECFIVPSDGSVRAKRVTRLGALVLDSLPLPAPDADVVTKLLLDAVRAEGIVSLLQRDDEARELLARVSLLASLDSAPGDWPDLGEEALDASMGEWLGPSLLAAGSVKALARQGFGPLIQASLLTYEQQRVLAEAAPTTLVTPAGTTAKLCYAPPAEGWGEDGATETQASGGSSRAGPVLESKLQEWFGATKSPRVGPHEEIPVRLQLLSPAGRPLAITQDLAFFWQNGYVTIRSELRARYAKHPWPEDPLTAIPTRQTNNALRAAAAQTETNSAPSAAKGKGGGTGGGKGKKGKKR